VGRKPALVVDKTSPQRLSPLISVAKQANLLNSIVTIFTVLPLRARFHTQDSHPGRTNRLRKLALTPGYANLPPTQFNRNASLQKTCILM
jgi:hypothetical protein